MSTPEERLLSYLFDPSPLGKVCDRLAGWCFQASERAAGVELDYDPRVDDRSAWPRRSQVLDWCGDCFDDTGRWAQRRRLRRAGRRRVGVRR